MGEIEWTRKLCEKMKQQGAIVIALVASTMQQNGLPDRVLIHKKLGKSVFLEFKGETTILRLNQKRMMARMNQVVPRTAFIVRAPNCIEYCMLTDNNKSVAYNIGFFEEEYLLYELGKIINAD